MFFKKISTLLFLTLFLTSAQSFAQGRYVDMATIEVAGLSKYSGKNLTAFYVAGRPPGMGIPGTQLYSNKIFAIQGPVVINDQGIGVIPKISRLLRIQGVARLNYVIFVVHEGPRVALRNIDETCPAPSDQNRTDASRDHCALFLDSEFDHLFQDYEDSRNLEVREGRERVRIFLSTND